MSNIVNKTIRNIKLHVLTDMDAELDFQTTQIYTQLKNTFDNLNIYKSDLKENRNNLYYGKTESDLIIKYDSYYGDIAVPLTYLTEFEDIRKHWYISYDELKEIMKWYISELLNLNIQLLLMWPNGRIELVRNRVRKIGNV